MHDLSFDQMSAKRLMATRTSCLFDDPYIAVRVIVVLCGILAAVVQKLIWNVSVFQYISVLQENPYWGAAFGIFGLGAAMTFLQQGWALFWRCYSKYMTSSLQVPINDQYFNMLVQWLCSLQMDSPFHVAIVSRSVTYDQFGNQNTLYDNDGNPMQTNGKTQPPFDFLPQSGIHSFEFNGELIFVSTASDDISKKVGLQNQSPGVTLSVKKRDTGIFREILKTAYEYSQNQSAKGIQIFTAHHGAWNNRSDQPRRKRPMESVVLDQGVSDKLMKDLDEFRRHSKWYLDRAIPYRRGYLLHGPPGTGKTSLITALAGHYNMNIGILNLGEAWLDDDSFSSLVNNPPQDSILILEDVDAAFVNRAEQSEDYTMSQGKKKGKQNKSAPQPKNQLTFSGFLNALDGVNSADGRILIMTTNHIEHLDQALIRPGRVDLQQEIGYASEYQLVQIYMRFYPEQTEAQAKDFALKALETNSDITLAQVQGLFVMHKYDPENLHGDLQLLLKKNAGPRRHNL